LTGQVKAKSAYDCIVHCPEEEKTLLHHLLLAGFLAHVPPWPFASIAASHQFGRSMMLSGLVKGTVDPAFLTRTGSRLCIAAGESLYLSMVQPSETGVR
jgi:hypothetical protein